MAELSPTANAAAGGLASVSVPSRPWCLDSRRRDCHSAAPPSPFSRRFKKDNEAMSVK